MPADKKRNKILNRKPANNEGNNGDIVISRISGKGMFLFAKHNNRWYGTKMSENPAFSAKKQQPKESKHLTTHGSHTIGDKIIFPDRSKIHQSRETIVSADDDVLVFDLKDSTNSPAVNYLKIVGNSGHAINLLFHPDAKEDAADVASITVGDGGEMTLQAAGKLKLDSQGDDVEIDGIVAGVSDYDKFLVLDGLNIKYRTGAEVLSDIGAGTPLTTEQVQDIVGAMFTGNTETNTAVTYEDSDGTIDVVTTLDGAPLTTEAVQDIVGGMFSGNTETNISATYEDSDGTVDLAVSDAFITNDADDTMAGALTIDKNTSGDAAENAIGLKVDFDRTVATSGTNAHNDIGIDLDIDSRSLGTSTVKGMDIDVVGHTDGTHTATGITLDVSAADDNIGLAITTPDGATGRKDIRLYSSADVGDHCTIYTGTNGTTFIQTADNSANGAHLTLDVDGDIILDSATGEFIAKQNGTEFSVANSAYAGMILAFTTMQYATTSQYYSTTTSYAVLNKSYDHGDGTENHYLGVEFVVPPSNIIEVEVYLPYCGNCDGTLSMGLATDKSATTLNARYETNAWDVDETDAVQVNKKWVIKGADHSWSAGQTKELYCMVKEGVAGGRLYWGDGLANYGDMTMKVTALPATIGDGTTI